MTHDPTSGAPTVPEDVQPHRRTERPRRLDPAARARIGRGLRLLYAEALTQPVPERLERIVAQLGDAPAVPDAAGRTEEPSR